MTKVDTVLAFVETAVIWTETFWPRNIYFLSVCLSQNLLNWRPSRTNNIKELFAHETMGSADLSSTWRGRKEIEVGESQSSSRAFESAMPLFLLLRFSFCI